MAIQVTKRNGKKESLDLEKLHKVVFMPVTQLLELVQVR